MWPDPYLEQGVYNLLAITEHLAKALYVVVMLRNYLYVLNCLAGPQFHQCSICYVQVAVTFTLNFGVAIAIAT